LLRNRWCIGFNYDAGPACRKDRDCKKAEHIEKIDLAVAFERYAHLGAGMDLNPFLIENFSMKN